MFLRLIHYFDVWGNAKEGFEVNNFCEQAILEFPEWPTKEEILKRLKKIDFINKTVRMRSVRWDENYSDAIGIEDRDGRPVAFLERIFEKEGKEIEPYHLDGAKRIVYDEIKEEM